MNEFPQEIIGRYQLVHQLGSGGMGAVYKAQDLKLKRAVALKIMHPSLSHNQEFRDRFLQEAQSGARLKHPGIVQVHDICEEDDYLFIVEDFIAGENLTARMKVLRAENQTMPVEEAVELVRQVSLALGYAHEHGVLHRDIKPANILLEPVSGERLPYRPVLTDLGLAKLMVGGLETMTGISLGTPAYMAPEQALGQAADARSDIYALGVLLYELVSGRLPFSLKTVSDAVRCHMYEPPPVPPPLPAGIPEKLSDLLIHTLQRNREARPANALAFATMLERVLEVGKGSARAAVVREEDRGPSIWKKFQSPEEERDLDRMEVFLPGGECHIVNLQKGALIIGRDENSDIVLDDLKASRKHARLEFDGVLYRLTDLNSTNGSFLGKTRLLPGVDEPWDPEKPLRIGDHYLRLVRAKGWVDAKKFKSEGTVVDLKPAISSPGRGWVGVAVPQVNLIVEAGRTAALTFSMINQGTQVDQYQIFVEGMPNGWVQSIPALLPLQPGKSLDITLPIQPPRHPDSRATRYPFILRVKSQNNPAEVVDTRCALTILPYSQFTSQLQPQRLKSGETGRIIIQNLGNVVETFTITLIDQSEELVFSLSESKLRIQEGKSESLEFSVRTRKSHWMGGEKKYPFTVNVATETKPGSSISLQPPPQVQPGELVSKGRFSAWLGVKIL
jgi:eukaryotic-like serine/threonine-protein kinase